MSSMDELKTKMLEAIKVNDVKTMETLATEIAKGATDRRKAEAGLALKEAEKLAGVREELAKSTHQIVKGLNLDKTLRDVKATGFTYTVAREELDGKLVPAGTGGSVKISSGLSLLVPTIKAKHTGAGAVGKTKDEYGKTLTEIFEERATAEDRIALAAAEAKDKIASEKLGKTTNSNAWRTKNEVKKGALAAGLIAPIK